MGKKRLILGSSIIIFGLGLFCIVYFSLVNKDNNEYLNYKVSSAEADYDILDGINALEEKAPIVVKVKYTGKRIIKEWKDTSGQVLEKSSETTLKVSEVLKGSLNSDSPNITVYEPAHFENNTFVSIEGYNLMQNGKDYILFLRPMPDDEAYIIVGMYQGKYDLSSSELATPAKSVNKYEDIIDKEYFGDNIEGFNKLKTQVLKKYKNNK